MANFLWHCSKKCCDLHVGRLHLQYNHVQCILYTMPLIAHATHATHVPKVPPPPQPSVVSEKMRGAVVSLISGTTASSLNFFCIYVLGISAPVSTAICMNLFGSILSYSLDILFAKKDFTVIGGGAPVPLSYGLRDPGHFRMRLKWWLKSFRKRFFFRFVVTVIIETLTVVALIRAAIRTMDDANFLMEHRKMRDAATSLVASGLVFIFFGNILRFDWAYREVEDKVMNIVVLAWLAMSVLVASSLVMVNPRCS